MTRLFKESKILIHFISFSHVNFSKLCCKLAKTTILGRGDALFFPPDYIKIIGNLVPSPSCLLICFVWPLWTRQKTTTVCNSVCCLWVKICSILGGELYSSSQGTPLRSADTRRETGQQLDSMRSGSLNENYTYGFKVLASVIKYRY